MCTSETPIYVLYDDLQFQKILILHIDIIRSLWLLSEVILQNNMQRQVCNDIIWCPSVTQVWDQRRAITQRADKFKVAANRLLIIQLHVQVYDIFYLN